MAKRYETSRIGNGQVKVSTYEREEQRRIERTIELSAPRAEVLQMMELA